MNTNELLYQIQRRADGARPARDSRAFLRDLEPELELSFIASRSDREIAELVELGVEALMEAEL